MQHSSIANFKDPATAILIPDVAVANPCPTNPLTARGRGSHVHCAPPFIVELLVPLLLTAGFVLAVLSPWSGASV